jgi:hypothetical protein
MHGKRKEKKTHFTFFISPQTKLQYHPNYLKRKWVKAPHTHKKENFLFLYSKHKIVKKSTLTKWTSFHLVHIRIRLPAVLKPDFDLFGLNVGKNGTLPNELLPSQRARLWAFCVHPLQCLHLLWRIPHVLAGIHLLIC